MNKFFKINIVISIALILIFSASCFLLGIENVNYALKSDNLAKNFYIWEAVKQFAVSVFAIINNFFLITLYKKETK